MPVTVVVPTRIRTDEAALDQRAEWLETRLSGALSRTLASSREAVLAERGGYIGVRCEPPDVVWSGDGLDAVDNATRGRIESMIGDVITRSVSDAGLYDFVRDAANAPPVLPPNGYEVVDDRRYATLLDLYEVPTYQGGGKGQAGRSRVPVTQKGGRRRTPPHAEQHIGWKTTHTTREYTLAWSAELRARGLRLPDDGFFGFMYRDATVGGALYVRVYGFPSRHEVGSGDVDNLGTIEVEKTEVGNIHFSVKPISLSAESEYFLSYFRSGSSHADRKAAFMDFYGEGLAQTLTLKGLPAPEVQRTITTFVEERARSTRCTLLKLTVDGNDWLLKDTTDQEWPVGFRAPIIPLRMTIPQQVVDDGEDGDSGAGEDGAGAGRKLGTGVGTKGGRKGNAGRAGTGEGAEDEGAGGFVYSGSSTGKSVPMFPSVKGADAVTTVCDPFEDEPSLKALGSAGENLKAQIDDIAYRLQMPLCDTLYAGSFCLNAVQVLSGRAGAIGDYATQSADFTREVTLAAGNLGSVDFIPTASPAIQFMRHLAGVAWSIDMLQESINQLYRSPDVRPRVNGGDVIGWLLHFGIELVPSLRRAISHMFIDTCRILLLRLLLSSHNEVQKRIDNFPTYFPHFSQMVRAQLVDLGHLIDLRSRLEVYAIWSASHGHQNVHALAHTPSTSWRTAAQSVADALSGRPDTMPDQTVAVGEVVTTGNEPRIRDRKGNLWSMHELEASIAVRRGVAEDIDPLVKQLTDIPDIAERFQRGGTALLDELVRILTTMRDENRNQIRTVQNEYMYGFRASKIREGLPSEEAAGTGVVMQGIHLLAHQQIGDYFLGSSFYRSGVQDLFHGEIAREEVKGFIEFTGLVLLSVVCPPAGFIAGVAAGIYHVEQAEERKELFESLINPELVLSRAEVEAELFAQELGLALQFIPEVGNLIKGARFGIKAVAVAGLEEGAVIIGRQAAKQISKQVAEALAREFVTAFVTEMVKAEVLNYLISRVLQPVLERVGRGVTITGSVGGSKGAESVLRMLQAERLSEGG